MVANNNGIYFSLAKSSYAFVLYDLASNFSRPPERLFIWILVFIVSQWMADENSGTSLNQNILFF